MRWSLIVVAGCGFSGDAATDDGATGGDAANADARVTDGPVRDSASGDADPDAPIVPPDAATSILIEAESPTTATSLSGGYNWVVETTLAGYTGTGYVTALPNTGTPCNPFSPTCGCRNNYDFVVAITGTYQLTLRRSSPDTASDSGYWGIDGVLVGTESFNPDDDSFHDGASITTVPLTAGPHTFDLWMRENGMRFDHFRLDLQ